MTKYCIVHKTGISGAGAYIIEGKGWLYDSHEDALQAMLKLPESQFPKIAIATVIYDE